MWPIIRSADIAARPGQTYKLTAWMRAEPAGTKAALGAQAWKRDTYSWSQSDAVSVGPQWKQYELVFKFPAEKDRGYHGQRKPFTCGLICARPRPLWIDDVCLQEAVPQDGWEAWRDRGKTGTRSWPTRNSSIRSATIIGCGPARRPFRWDFGRSPSRRSAPTPTPWRELAHRGSGRRSGKSRR